MGFDFEPPDRDRGTAVGMVKGLVFHGVMGAETLALSDRIVAAPLGGIWTAE